MTLLQTIQPCSSEGASWLFYVTSTWKVYLSLHIKKKCVNLGLTDFSCFLHICQLSVTEVLKLGSLYFSSNDNAATCGHARNILSQEHKNKIKILIKMVGWYVVVQRWWKTLFTSYGNLEESAVPGTPAERTLKDGKKTKLRNMSCYSVWVKDKLQSELTPERHFGWWEIKKKKCTAKHVNE